MKYNDNNKPLVCMMTQSTCYKGTSKMDVKGVLWHSTGCNQTGLWRFVQPDDKAANRKQLLELLGQNNNRNDWNHIYMEAGLNAWIGKLNDGTVATVQTMPWDYKPWGCGGGTKGSCNSGWIQFEICEDALNNKEYFDAVYKEACELTAYLCKMFNIDPNGYSMLNGVKVPNILCHKDSCALGLGSNHGDVMHWFPKFGKNMDTVRADVAKLINENKTADVQNNVKKVEEQVKPVTPTTPVTPAPTTTNKLAVGQEMKLITGAKFIGGEDVPNWVINSKLYVRDIRSNGDVVFSTLKTGAVTGVVNPKYIAGATVIVEEKKEQPAKVVETPAATAVKVGDVIKIKAGAKYIGGQAIPDWVIKSTLYAREIRSNGDVVFSTLKTGAITGVVAAKDIEGNNNAVATPAAFAEYRVKVTDSALNIRKGPGTSYAIAGVIRDFGVYTIVAEDGDWLKLKSGAGWIYKDYTKRV